MLKAIAQKELIRVTGGKAPRPPTTWFPPAQGCFKMNSDGSKGIEDGMAKYGGLIRDVVGSWVIGFAKAIGVCSVVEAELWGCLHRCSLFLESPFL
ncbi:hypothetical protein V6N11_045184 [Hibiscus sabdariffa]